MPDVIVQVEFQHGLYDPCKICSKVLVKDIFPSANQILKSLFFNGKHSGI